MVPVMILSLVAAGFFAVKSYRSYVVLSSARALDIPRTGDIRAWMTIGYVANAHGADSAALLATLALDKDTPPDATLKSLAEQTGQGKLEFVQRVQQALARVPHPVESAPPVEEDSGWLSALWEQTYSALLTTGYPVLGVILLLGALGLPVPAGPLTSIAGSLAQQGDFNGLIAATIALTASVLGDLLGYLAGRLLPLTFLRRHGRWVGYTEANRQRLDRLFARFGGLTLVLTRSLVSHVAAIASLLAGAGRYSPGLFLAYSVVGRGIWVLAYFGLGYAVGTDFETASGFLGYLSLCLIFLAIGVGAANLRFRHRQPDRA